MPDVSLGSVRDLKAMGLDKTGGSIESISESCKNAFNRIKNKDSFLLTEDILKEVDNLKEKLEGY